MDTIAEFFDCGILCMENYRFLVVGYLPFGLCVDSKHRTPAPDGFHQFLKIPLLPTTDRYIVWHLVQNIELLDCEGINFVEYVKHGDVTVKESEVSVR